MFDFKKPKPCWNEPAKQSSSPRHRSNPGKKQDDGRSNNIFIRCSKCSTGGLPKHSRNTLAALRASKEYIRKSTIAVNIIIMFWRKWYLQVPNGNYRYQCYPRNQCYFRSCHNDWLNSVRHRTLDWLCCTILKLWWFTISKQHYQPMHFQLKFKWS